MLTSVFVHLAVWHLVFNVYWLWVLGNRVEKTIGSLRFLAFFVTAALVSSSCQLAISGQTGYGASGVGYAIFGLMWPLRRRFPQFGAVLDQRIVSLFLVWLIACVVVTYLKIWEVGNAAHISGLLFGYLVAGSFVAKYKPRLCSLVYLRSLFWQLFLYFGAPGASLGSPARRAAAQEHRQYPEAVDLYTRILRLDPNNAWACYNRGSIYQALGERDKAEADFEKAQKLDPEDKNSKIAWLTINASRAQEHFHYREAVDFYSQILEVEPNSAWACYNRGCAYYALGEREKAEADFEKAHKLDPKIGNAR